MTINPEMCDRVGRVDCYPSEQYCRIYLFISGVILVNFPSIKNRK